MDFNKSHSFQILALHCPLADDFSTFFNLSASLTRLAFIPPMNLGPQFKQSFKEILRLAGCTVLIHRRWGKESQETFETRGMKNNEKSRPDKVMFQFPEALGIQIGDILQQKGARDLWRVVDLEDHVSDDVYVNFEAKVEKCSGPTQGPTPGRTQVIVHGPVYGGLQVGSPHSTQNISLQVPQVDENICELRKLLNEATISDLDREEAVLALDRIAQLSQKEKSPEVMSKLKERLEFVKTTFDLAKDIGGVAAPYIAAIMQAISQ